jgi:putative hemolysin
MLRLHASFYAALAMLGILFAAPPATADGKPKVTAQQVRLENDVVELALEVLAPGKTIEAVRIDNVGGVSSLWRSDGKDKADPLSVSHNGQILSSGAQVMSLAAGDAEVPLSLSLKDNGAFAGKATEFRATVFFADKTRVMCMVEKAQAKPAQQPAQPEQPQSQSALGARYVAVSDTEMTWDEAKAWCAARGGRLPLINGASSLSSSDVVSSPGTVSIDGIGPVSMEGTTVDTMTRARPRSDFTTPWSSTGLPSNRYWTGTEYGSVSGNAWSVHDTGLNGGTIYLGGNRKRDHPNRAVCVPSSGQPGQPQTQTQIPQPQTPAKPAEPQVRPPASDKGAEKAPKSPGFIAVSDTEMPWEAAQAYCLQQGGRLPLVDGSESLLGGVPKGIHIEGFGAKDIIDWPADLPRNSYWTGTPSHRTLSYMSPCSWRVGERDGKVILGRGSRRLKDHTARVVCVP